MRQALLDPTVLDRLGAADPPRRWQDTLLAGSFLVDLGEGPGREAVLFREIREGLVDLWRQEEAIERWRNPISWAAGGVRIRDVLILLAILGVAVWGVGMFTQGMSPILASKLQMLPVFLLVIPGLISILWQERRRRQSLESARHMYQQRIAQLQATIQELSTLRFVIHAPGVTVLSLPEYVWLGHRLRDLRESRSPVDPPERRELVAEMRKEFDRMEEEIRRIAAGQPVDVSTLSCDVSRYTGRFRALGVRRGGEGAHLARLLEGADRS